MDAAAPASHLEYKLVSCSKEDENYRCSQLNNHSITSGSSNHTELIRAYEFGRNFHQNLDSNFDSNHQMQDHCKGFYYKDEDEDEYTNNASNCSIMSDETPTDPGIRRFTKSPPKPNETRTAGCFAVGSKINNEESADDDDDGDDEGSAQVEDGDDSDSESVLTASPASSEPELSSPSTPTNDQQPADVFAAIPRNRSRHPSWAQTRMTQMYNKQELHQNRRRELDLVREGLTEDLSIDRQRNQRREEEVTFKKETRKTDAKKMSNPLHASSHRHHHLLSSHPPSSSSSPAHHHLLSTHSSTHSTTHFESPTTAQAAGGVFPRRKLHLFSLFLSLIPSSVSHILLYLLSSFTSSFTFSCTSS